MIDLINNLDELDIIEEEQREVFKAGNFSERYVGGEGNSEDPIAFIFGEAPGAQEDIKLRPFVGTAGQVLRMLMMSAGLHSDWRGKLTGLRVIPHCKEGVSPNCWLTNTVKFRPLVPGNRTPTRKEIDKARPLLRREWQAVGKPRIIIPVGGPALYAVMGRQMSILRMAGRMITRQRNHGPQPHIVHIWPMIHPSFGLRNKQVQPLIERDWERLGKFLSEHSA